MTKSTTKKPRSVKMVANSTEPSAIINPLSPKRVALTQRLAMLAHDPADLKEFEAVRDELHALPPNE